jgi:predicted NodU family carbamoyl transferase
MDPKFLELIQTFENRTGIAVKIELFSNLSGKVISLNDSYAQYKRGSMLFMFFSYEDLFEKLVNWERDFKIDGD